MKDLKVLNLSIPTLDSSECKTLMGGDGYAWEKELPEVVITPDTPPDRSDFYDHEDPLNDDPNDYEYDYDYDHDNDNEDGDSDYKIPDQLKETFEKLPEKVQAFLKENNIKITYDPNYRSPNGGIASYIPGDNSIITSSLSLDDNTLLREAIHAVQDAIGALDVESRSAEEFQEKALGDLADFFDSMFNDGGGFGFTLDSGCKGESGWSEFLMSCFDDDGKFDRDAFKNGIMDYFDEFQEGHKDIPGYNDPLEDDYNWSWDYFFGLLGL